MNASISRCRQQKKFRLRSTLPQGRALCRSVRDALSCSQPDRAGGFHHSNVEDMARMRFPTDKGKTEIARSFGSGSQHDAHLPGAHEWKPAVKEIGPRTTDGLGDYLIVAIH